MPIQQITIIGTGSIGGSIALSLKALGHDKGSPRIVGCDRPEVLASAQARGAIDQGIADPVLACQGSQVVVLACPVGCIMDMLERLGPVLPDETLITDVGSTKAAIVERAKAVFGANAPARFLPGHPMAGKEHGGIEQADDHLFRGAVWFFTPADPSAPQNSVVNEYEALIRAIGARPLWIRPDDHDQLCAWISHLPQMVSIAISCALLDFQQDFATHGDSSLDLRTVAGRQFREITRTASSPYSMWRDVALTNTANLEEALLKLEQQLAHIRENLKTPELRAQFEKAARIAPKKPTP
jgi:prephenate dehydrogenase